MFKRWRRGEDGSVAITATATLVLLSTIVMLVLRSGHAATTKRELQSAADAAAVALAAQIRENGVPQAPQADGKIGLTQSIRDVIDAHTKLSYTVEGRLLDSENQGNTTWAKVEIKLIAQYTSPFNVFNSGTKELIYTSRARVRETTIGGAKKWPAALLMVDRSASTSASVRWGGSQTRFEVLKQVVSTFASNPFPVRLGVMFYHRHVDDGARRVPPPKMSPSRRGASCPERSGRCDEAIEVRPPQRVCHDARGTHRRAGNSLHASAKDA